MTADEARDEVYAIFKAVSDTTGLEVAYDDSPARDNSDGWARVTLRHATGRQSSLSGAMGTRRFTRTGTLWVQVFAPVGDGNATALSLAETVVNAYQAASGTVWYRNVRMREQGSDGAFARVDVLADFTYDSFT